MMLHGRRMIRVAMVAISVGFVPSAGCGGLFGSSLPQTATITLPDGTTQQATLGSGVLSLADTTWALYHAAGPRNAEPFVTVNFGPNGNLESFDGGNIGGMEMFGPSIFFDGRSHGTTQPGVTYTAGTYGAETSDASGFAFVGRLKAFAAGLTIADATATATGSFDADDPDQMSGTFQFEATVTIPGMPQEDYDESFEFRAELVTE